LASLLALLEQLVVVNDRPALLARYQAELEEQLRREPSPEART
jgi:hypothetical protein